VLAIFLLSLKVKPMRSELRQGMEQFLGRRFSRLGLRHRRGASAVPQRFRGGAPVVELRSGNGNQLYKSVI